jgi:hypothetical protein
MLMFTDLTKVSVANPATSKAAARPVTAFSERDIFAFAACIPHDSCEARVGHDAGLMMKVPSQEFVARCDHVMFMPFPDGAVVWRLKKWRETPEGLSKVLCRS